MPNSRVSDKSIQALTTITKDLRTKGNHDVANILEQTIDIMDVNQVASKPLIDILDQEFKIIKRRHLQVHGKPREIYKKQILAEILKTITETKENITELKKAVSESKDDEDKLILLAARVKSIGSLIGYLSGSDEYKSIMSALRMLQIAELCATQDSNSEVNKLAARIAILRKSIEKEII